MSKNQVKVKFTGVQPDGDKLLAKIPTTITGNKIAFTHRHMATIDTGVFVTVENGYKLCFKLAPEFANKGMIAVNSPGDITSGQVSITLLNCGREIVEVKNNDSIAVCWLEKTIDFTWEKQ
jgi:dUTPase